MVAIGSAAVLLALSVTSATAAPTSRVSATESTSLCSVARGVARDIARSRSFTNGNVTPATLKSTYLRIRAAEPALLSAASGRLKTDLRQVFGFINLAITDLKKVGWQPSALAPYATTLLARAQRATPSLDRLNIYFRRTCKLKI